MAQGGVHFSGSSSNGRNAELIGTANSLKELKSRDLPSYFRTVHKKNVLRGLQVLETDVKSGRPIRWNTLLPAIRGMRANGKKAPDCLKFAMELLRLFERHHCRDASVISEVFLAMIYLTSGNLPYADVYEYAEMSKSLYMPYGTEIDFKSKMDLTWNAARSANLGLLKLLLKFGIGLLTPYFTLDSCFDKTECLLHFWPNQTVYPSTLERPDWRIHDKLRSVFNPASRKRTNLVLGVLEIVRTMLGYMQFADYFSECYRLLFDSIPEAYVTSVEVKTLLEKHLPDAYTTLIPAMTEAFETLLPELAEVPQPRCLKHLCRIRVRDSLRRNLNLPHGVSSLPLPAHLKRYITLHDDGDYGVMIKTYKHLFDTGYRFWPASVINIPEEDDAITSILKNL